MCYDNECSVGYHVEYACLSTHTAMCMDMRTDMRIDHAMGMCRAPLESSSAEAVILRIGASIPAQQPWPSAMPRCGRIAFRRQRDPATHAATMATHSCRPNALATMSCMHV